MRCIDHNMLWFWSKKSPENEAKNYDFSPCFFGLFIDDIQDFLNFI